jgi:hypothetical protein
MSVSGSTADRGRHDEQLLDLGNRAIKRLGQRFEERRGARPDEVLRGERAQSEAVQEVAHPAASSR